MRRFVHCGTEAALMAGEPLVHVDETAPLRPDSPAPYPATKARAELAVREANRDGFETVAMRPRFVWGRGDTTLLPEMVRTVEAGQFAWVGGGRNVTDTAHVDNVVEGLLLCAAKGRPGEAYFITDGEPVVFREFVTELLRTQGVEPPDRSLPAWTAAPLARVCELLWKLPLPGEPPMSRFRSWILTQECTIEIGKAREELGYRPLVSHEQGLAEMAAAGLGTTNGPRAGARARRPSASCAGRRSGPAGAGPRLSSISTTRSGGTSPASRSITIPTSSLDQRLRGRSCSAGCRRR